MDELLNNLNDKEKKLFLSQCTQKLVKKGEIIKKEGEKTKEAFFIQKGKVAVKKSSTEGEMHIATIKDSNTCFSLTCLIDGKNTLTTIQALEDTQIIVIKQKEFFEFCTKNPTIGVKLISNIAKLLTKFLRNSDEKIIQMYKTLEEVL